MIVEPLARDTFRKVGLEFLDFVGRNTLGKVGLEFLGFVPRDPLGKGWSSSSSLRGTAPEK